MFWGSDWVCGSKHKMFCLIQLALHLVIEDFSPAQNRKGCLTLSTLPQAVGSALIRCLIFETSIWKSLTVSLDREQSKISFHHIITVQRSPFAGL
jgi:hypothetical protein